MLKHCLIVLGMHRSGTSCLTGTIEQCGVALGEVFTENPYNKKGNRESAQIQALNNDILEINGGAWDRPVAVTKWTAEQSKERDETLDQIRSGVGHWWGFKDPRLVLTLPFWLEAIDEPRFIGTFRHPHRVALSLQNRNRMSLNESYKLWRGYNERLIDYIDRFNFQVVDFDLDDAEYQKDVAEKLQGLGLKSQINECFFDPKLRNQSLESAEDCALPENVNEIYQKLKAIHAAL